MKKLVFRILKILNIIIFKIKNPSIEVSVFANVSPYFLKNIDKKLKNIILGNSNISKDVKINEGVKFLGELTVSGKIEVGTHH